MSNLRSGLLVLAVAAAPATACSDNVGGPDITRTPRPWASGPPGEALLEAMSGDDVLLSYVVDAVADSEGRVYVLDFQEAGVIALNADLIHDRTIGREGEGPGEFTRPGSMQVLPGDSLLVWDYQPQRITVFPPGSDEAAYVRPLGTQELGSDVQGLAGSLGYLARSSTAYRADASDEGETRIAVLRHIREEGGRVVDELVYQYPAAESLVLRGDGSVSVSGHPFGRSSFVGLLGAEQIVHASSDALEVRIVDLQGGVRTAFAFPTTPVAVTGRELAAAADGLSSAMGSLLREGAPYVWPTLTGLVVDDQDRIWLGIHTGDPSTREWAAFMPDGTHVVSVDLPVGLEVHAVRDGRVIGSGVDELDVPRVLAYRLP
ncbi:MAG: hypothetical protein OXE96_01755 [Gemmatimonadetes bacterium]|nr:hypothetical protein [Gemmatimonadota bacterium]